VLKDTIPDGFSGSSRAPASAAWPTGGKATHDVQDPASIPSSNLVPPSLFQVPPGPVFVWAKRRAKRWRSELGDGTPGLLTRGSWRLQRTWRCFLTLQRLGGQAARALSGGRWAGARSLIQTPPRSVRSCSTVCPLMAGPISRQRSLGRGHAGSWLAGANTSNKLRLGAVAVVPPPGSWRERKGMKADLAPDKNPGGCSTQPALRTGGRSSSSARLFCACWALSLQRPSCSRLGANEARGRSAAPG